MRSAVINNTRSQETFSVLSKVIQSQGFVFLHCDNHNFEIEAIVESRFKFAKHLNARLVELSLGTELIVELRYIGLEIKRKRSNDKLITPPLKSTILPGITRKSFLELTKEAGYEVEERAISVSEVIEAIKSGDLKELFGVGTAATTAQVEKLTFEGNTYDLPSKESRVISNSIGQKLLRIKKGIDPDTHGWNISI